MVTVFGLWHLGSVTAACCAEHFPTVGLDPDEDRIRQLSEGQAPLHEPGLDSLIQAGIESKNLHFSSNLRDVLSNTQVLWVTFDTPVDDDDHADTDWVIDQIRSAVPLLNPGTVVLISSQLPVTTTRKLEQEFSERQLYFAVSPENLRLGKSLEIFRSPGRIVVGTRNDSAKEVIAKVLEPFCDNILWMSIESAEMTKHAINAFLAVSVTYANELARLCEGVGANAHEVAQGLKSESRIGPGAYVSPGGAFAGGTLARDVQFLKALASVEDAQLFVIPAILQSNTHHKSWALTRLQEILGKLTNRRIGILGLTYKPGTSTLRRSNALELAKRLVESGAKVSALDPAVQRDDAELGMIELASSAEDLFQFADAVVLMTEWPEFRTLDWNMLIPLMNRPVILDQDRFCGAAVDATGLAAKYYSVGVS
ncbi:MAG: nucleotide sugar dehydrogenase [Pseudomonadota bacterium]